MKIVFLGPPGAGKGTQAKRLSKRYQIPHLSTGDILRTEIQAGSRLGRLVADKMNAGELVEDDIISSIVLNRLSMPDAKLGFILDGYPRTIEQADVLEKALGATGLTVVIELLVDEGDLLTRISARAEEAKSEGVAARSDDNVDVLRRRLEAYNRQTRPLSKHYGIQGLLIQINGLAKIDIVTSTIEFELNQKT